MSLPEDGTTDPRTSEDALSERAWDGDGRGRLAGKVALITGASRGIGHGIAERLLRDGASVMISSRSDEDLRRVAGELRDRLPVARLGVHSADVRSRADVQSLVDAAVDRFGSLDIAVANAGVEHGTPFLEIDDDTWDAVVETNLSGAFYTTQAAARAMLEGPGRIVLIASTNAFFVETNIASYNASKAGVVGLMRAAAIELAPHGITVNAVGPGLVHTEMTDDLVRDPVHGPHYLQQIPCGRFGTPADIAAAVAYLVSDDAAWVTGHHLVADGGQTVGVRLPLETVSVLDG